jgi:hypothetical protein
MRPAVPNPVSRTSSTSPKINLCGEEYVKALFAMSDMFMISCICGEANI